MNYDKNSQKCQDCDMLFDFLHNAYSHEPPCEYCPYIDEDFNMEDLEEELQEYEK